LNIIGDLAANLNDPDGAPWCSRSFLVHAQRIFKFRIEVY
jgi:hypothetical protein